MVIFVFGAVLMVWCFIFGAVLIVWYALFLELFSWYGMFYFWSCSHGMVCFMRTVPKNKTYDNMRTAL
jgi:hypothetical protein